MSRIEVTTTATLLDSATGSEYQAQDILIMAEASNAATIYVGTTSAVTTLTGVPLEPGAILTQTYDGAQAFYGIVASGSAHVRVVETYPPRDY